MSLAFLLVLATMLSNVNTQVPFGPCTFEVFNSNQNYASLKPGQSVNLVCPAGYYISPPNFWTCGTPEPSCLPSSETGTSIRPFFPNPPGFGTVGLGNNGWPLILMLLYLRNSRKRPIEKTAPIEKTWCTSETQTLECKGDKVMKFSDTFLGKKTDGCGDGPQCRLNNVDLGQGFIINFEEIWLLDSCQGENECIVSGLLHNILPEVGGCNGGTHWSVTYECVSSL